MSAHFRQSTLDAYERWAASYPPVPHNPLMRAEQAAVLARWPEVQGKRVLDLACGTGRYVTQLAKRGAAEAIAVDFSAAMLRRVNTGQRVRADMLRLPFASGSFDLVVAGLAIGHAESLDSWMHEVARILKTGGVVVYSDFHPAAARAGMTRTFRDSGGTSHAVPHRPYELRDHLRASSGAGLRIDTSDELRVGIEFREEFAGAADFYRKWPGLPIVLVVRARK